MCWLDVVIACRPSHRQSWEMGVCCTHITQQPPHNTTPITHTQHPSHTFLPSHTTQQLSHISHHTTHSISICERGAPEPRSSHRSLQLLSGVSRSVTVFPPSSRTDTHLPECLQKMIYTSVKKTSAPPRVQHLFRVYSPSRVQIPRPKATLDSSHSPTLPVWLCYPFKMRFGSFVSVCVSFSSFSLILFNFIDFHFLSM